MKHRHPEFFEIGEGPNKHDHRLFRISLAKRIDTQNGFLVQRRANDAVERIGRQNADVAIPQDMRNMNWYSHYFAAIRIIRDYSYSNPFAARAWSPSSNHTLRRRTDFGVTSTSSSSAMYSIASSSVSVRGTFKNSDAPSFLLRILDNCFSLHTFTRISCSFEFCPTICPLYTSTPGPTKSPPRSSAAISPYARVMPVSCATSEPWGFAAKSPLYSSKSSKMVFIIPRPRVSVRN